MPDEASQPLCPICRSSDVIVVATTQDVHPVDVLLCRQCRTQFTTQQIEPDDKPRAKSRGGRSRT